MTQSVTTTIASMSLLSVVLLIAFAVCASIAIGWRLLSRRRLLPCPSSLVWLLENPIMEHLAGSAALMERAGVSPGMRVLDAGCGPGRLTIPLARRVGALGHVVALDAQLPMLSALRRRLEDQHLTNVRIIRAELGSGALAGEQFDRAFLVTVLGEIPDQERALREIRASLVPGGVLSITELLPDPHYQRQARVRKLALLTGFAPALAHGVCCAYTMNLTRSEPAGDLRADRTPL